VIGNLLGAFCWPANGALRSGRDARVTKSAAARLKLVMGGLEEEEEELFIFVLPSSSSLSLLFSTTAPITDGKLGLGL
jgi:hypothetical protein